MKKLYIMLVFLFGMLVAHPAYADDAHFFVRYDNTVQSESNNNDYLAVNYFPIGTVAKDYQYGISNTDYSSVDGQVDTNAAFVDGAEGIITQGKVNLYNKFGVTNDNIQEYFSPIYNHIVAQPDKSIISSSILIALGKDWQNAYDSGKVNIVWYVIKHYNNNINVDGVLYLVDSGDVVNKNDKTPIEKPTDAERPSEPTQPSLPEDPSEPEKPVTSEESKQDDKAEGHLNDSISQNGNKNVKATTTVKTEVIKNHKVPLAASATKDGLPQTGDKTIIKSLLTALIAVVLIILGFYWKYSDK